MSQAIGVQRWRIPETDIRGRLLADGRLVVDVREIDQDYARELIERSPTLRRDPNDDELLPEDEAVRRLLRLAHIRAWTKLSVSAREKSAGYVIRLAGGGDT